MAGFKGVVRLFPLPNLVLFPHVVQGLHIFEPRYRQMTADALAGDKLIALALLQPGWEAAYEGTPAIYPVACLGKIITDQRLADGRFNLLLRGLSRIRIVQEVSQKKLYRCARVELLQDASVPEPAEAVRMRRLLAERVNVWLPAEEVVLDQFRQLLDSELTLGTICDIFSFALPLDVEFKQRVLEELHVEQRAGRLLSYLKEHKPPIPKPPADHKFPPDFSAN